MKFFIRTLGCKMNWLDSARVSGALQGIGHEYVSKEEDADVILVNSCTVTSEADRKSRQISKAAGHSNKTIAVMGCGPKVDFDKWSQQLPTANIFQNENEIFNFFDITDDKSLFPLSSRTRLPVAIQHGCDNQCTFCITRVARGRHSNVPAEHIIEHIKLAEDHGIQEVVLTGINLAAWGCTDTNNADESRLPELLEKILTHTSIPRIRISSLGPQYLNDDFFEVFAEERLCDHLHLSIQSGSTDVVDSMIRGHGIDEIYYIAEMARKKRPDVALSCDLIVGFPGETDKHFDETIKLAKDIQFAKLHVFPFSVREGTAAEKLADQIPIVERKQRAGRLRLVGSELRRKFLQQQMGKERGILIEANGSGHTGNYIRVKAPLTGKEGEILSVVLSDHNVMER